MIGKVVLFAAFLAFVSADVAVPVHYHNPEYTYSYAVNDAITGDSKSQVESRSGDIVKGQYSLNDSDGTKRVVDYFADDVNGFNAIVSKYPLTAPVVAAPLAAARIAHQAYPYHFGAYPYAHYGGYPYAYGYAGYPYGRFF